MSERDIHVQPGGREKRIFGPPGCGKTTFLSEAIRVTARARGSDKLVAASFTKTAAAELAGRDLPIPKGQLGTLHALAYRAIDAPPLVEERLEDWNKAHPALALTIKPGSRANLDDGAPPESGFGATDGDELLSRMEQFRAKMRPREVWPQQVRDFANKWDAWKDAEGVIDFTDMIEIALENVPAAPGNPEVGFFDEVQDFTALELALVRKWGERMERIVLAGDDDQCLYRFKGATPDAFLDPPADDIDKRILSQSYRVPAAVHRAAEAWVKKLSRREPKVYLPREDEGSVAVAPFTYTDTKLVVNVLQSVIDEGKTAMVLATCGYMLDPIKHELKDQGLPFHNPYRRTRGDWNPLAGGGRGVPSKERLLAYLIMDEAMFGDASRLWTGGDVKKWAHVVKTQGIFVRGAKDRISELPDRELSYAEVAALFNDEAQLEEAVTPSLEWFNRNLLSASRDGMKFPIQVARRRGGAALLEEPKIVIGTIHSVKGGQADVVILFPDLSLRGNSEWQVVGEPQDSVIRQMYVGMTRAKERLIVGTADRGYSVPRDLLVAGARRKAS